MPTRRIVIVAMPGTLALDITGPADVFACAQRLVGQDGHRPEADNYQLLVASATEDLQVATSSGVIITCHCALASVVGEIDTLLIGGNSTDGTTYPALTAWLHAHAARIRRIGSVCVGAFVLAEAGLLRHRRATTHWRFCPQLSKAYEHISVDPNPIFVRDGNVYTSAGASAGIDLALALVEEDFGRDVSLQIARTLVLYLRRPGSQAQFSQLLSQQLASKKPIRDLQQWLQTNLQRDLTVAALAEHVAMSPRNFARVFAAETGLTPAKYIEQARVEWSRRYLEETDFSLDTIAETCGFGSADTMRLSYLRLLRTSPAHYRTLFGATR